MIVLHIGHDGHGGADCGMGPVALIRFAYENPPPAGTAAVFPGNDVGADQITGIQPRFFQDMRDHCRNTGFSVGSADRDYMRKHLSQKPKRLSAPDAACSDPARFRKFGIILRDRRTVDQQQFRSVRSRQVPCIMPGKNGNTDSAETRQRFRFRHVRS